MGFGEENIGETISAQQCAALVKSTKPRANGATWLGSTTNCYAQFGATYILPLNKSNCETCESCIFKGRLI